MKQTGKTEAGRPFTYELGTRAAPGQNLRINNDYIESCYYCKILVRFFGCLGAPPADKAQIGRSVGWLQVTSAHWLCQKCKEDPIARQSAPGGRTSSRMPLNQGFGMAAPVDPNGGGFPGFPQGFPPGFPPGFPAQAGPPGFPGAPAPAGAFPAGQQPGAFPAGQQAPQLAPGQYPPQAAPPPNPYPPQQPPIPIAPEQQPQAYPQQQQPYPQAYPQQQPYPQQPFAPPPGPQPYYPQPGQVGPYAPPVALPYYPPQAQPGPQPVQRPYAAPPRRAMSDWREHSGGPAVTPPAGPPQYPAQPQFAPPYAPPQLQQPTQNGGPPGLDPHQPDLQRARAVANGDSGAPVLATPQTAAPLPSHNPNSGSEPTPQQPQ